MSKSSIYGIQREFQHNLNLVYDIDRNLKDLKNDLLSAMNDTVGVSAAESIESINRNFRYYFEDAYKKSLNSINAIMEGYNQLSIQTENAQSDLSMAVNLVKELGNYE